MDPLLLGLLVAVIGIIMIAVVTALAQRLGVAGPLLLVGAGLVIALVPVVEIPPIDPELILVGILPPLLYSAAVNLPAVEFRRDFGPIAGLSVVLVVLSALVLGVFFWLMIPSVELPLGIALGAILSPTDAVATSIARRLGLAGRVVTMLEGESLLNDATALVLLRTAIAAIAAGFSAGGAVGAFVWGVFVAVVVGAAVGWLVLRLRAWVGSSAAQTAISFTVPFLAYIPAEQAGGSGLVAAVVAGIVMGQGARRRLTPEQRISDTLNWRTVELVLEGAVFLVMGLELREIVQQNLADSGGLWHGTWLALCALAIVLMVRAGYVSVIVWGQGRRARRMDRQRLESFGEKIDAMSDGRIPVPRGPGIPTDPERRQRRLDAMRTRIRRGIADIDYYQSTPLGWRHGSVIVWAGMRGVVTLAAAQTLPRDGVEHRALLVFVAFLVALVSLMLQGFTLPWLVRRLGLAGSGAEDVGRAEKAILDEQLRDAGMAALASRDLRRRDGTPLSGEISERVRERMSAPPDDEDRPAAARDRYEIRLITISAMRRRLDELSHDGSYSSAALRRAQAELDADELSIRLRLGEA